MDPAYKPTYSRAPPAPFFDVRMRGFRDRSEVEDGVALLASRLHALGPEAVSLHEAAGRVLAEDIVAKVAVPPFDRSAMDGYALHGEETFGAAPYNPLDLSVVGEAFPARPFASVLEAGQAVRIMTGAALPAGADAVLQAEAAEEVAGKLKICAPVPPGRNVGRRGEDIAIGSTVLRALRLLRPQDVGVLASIGAGRVSVVRRPSVALIITGDELLPAGSQPEGYKIVDSNSVMLAALVQRDGGIPRAALLIADSRVALKTVLAQCPADVILLSGGSSVGREDHAPGVVAELGELCLHGFALRPAGPAGVGFLDQRPIFLLPGNPVSCLCAYDFFAGPAVRRLGGRSMDWPYRSARLRAARKIVSAVGRVDYVRVLVGKEGVEPLATSGAAILTSTTRADGFVIVHRDSEGLAAGEEVDVFLYD
jgi:molybdopterin molybdotransferase